MPRPTSIFFLGLLVGCGTAADDAPLSPDAGADATAGDLADYVLFAPASSTTTYLIDRDGQIVHTWEADARPGLSVYLLDDGHLLRTESIDAEVFSGGGQGGRVTEYDWDGNVVWQFDYASAEHLSHHDVARMPNGHVLMIAWELIPGAEALGRQRMPTTGDVWSDHVIEVDPATSEIVWEWHVRDHLIQDYDSGALNYGVVEDHPELLDFNFKATLANDWTHVNGIAYDADLDQIMLSTHNLDEVWIIDHGTTTIEATGHTGGTRGHGGDFLYRWGNPVAYGGGTPADEQLYGQHDPQWIPDGMPGAGHLLIFNNGLGRTPSYSTVDEIELPLRANGTYGTGPDEPMWQYTADPPESMYSSNISGAQRLADGDTLICVGAEGRFLEVTPDGEQVWEYQYVGDGSAGRNVFRATSYRADYPGLAGKTLTPSGEIAP